MISGSMQIGPISFSGGMTAIQKGLLMGALKSAVGAACGLILALPIADPQRFSIVSLGGWGHLAEVIFIVVLAGEARYWKQWADSGDGAAPQ